MMKKQNKKLLFISLLGLTALGCAQRAVAMEQGGASSSQVQDTRKRKKPERSAGEWIGILTFGSEEGRYKEVCVKSLAQQGRARVLELDWQAWTEAITLRPGESAEESRNRDPLTIGERGKYDYVITPNMLWKWVPKGDARGAMHGMTTRSQAQQGDSQDKRPRRELSGADQALYDQFDTPSLADGSTLRQFGSFTTARALEAANNLNMLDMAHVLAGEGPSGSGS